MRASTRLITRFVQDESGATAIEYGLLLTFIAVFILVTVANLGTVLSGVFNKVSNKLQ